MENKEKVDINLSADISEEEMDYEEYYNLNYETAMRYINIAQHMKQFEEQDKYYRRSLKYLRNINSDGRFDGKISEIKDTLFKTSVDGYNRLYDEACYVRDHAKSPQDYYSAQTIFLRVNAYLSTHNITDRWLTPEQWEKFQQCQDPAEQAAKCEKAAIAQEAADKRQSLYASIAVIIAIIALLAFTRTASFHNVLGSVYSLIGDHVDAYQQFDALYKRTEKQEDYDKYLKARYAAAQKALKDNDKAEAYADFKALAKDNYEDSQHQYFLMEQADLKEAVLGEVVQFAGMDWRPMEKTDDRILLMKDHALGETPFNTNAGPCSWESSSLRSWLNGSYLEENFYSDEINAIHDTEVVNEGNPYYPGVAAGNNTTDKLFLLSIAEEEKYADLLHDTETCWWLRTPGANEGSMAFVYRYKEVMAYGYDVTNTEITVKPAIWVNLK